MVLRMHLAIRLPGICTQGALGCCLELHLGDRAGAALCGRGAGLPAEGLASLAGGAAAWGGASSFVVQMKSTAWPEGGSALDILGPHSQGQAAFPVLSVWWHPGRGLRTMLHPVLFLEEPAGNNGSLTGNCGLLPSSDRKLNCHRLLAEGCCLIKFIPTSGHSAELEVTIHFYPA